jgi:serine/threonine-protein kinase
MKATIAVLASVAALLSMPGAARAQGASDAATAQALFDAGRTLMSQGNYAAACPKLADSERLDPGAGTLMNLAGCYEKNGQTASAWATFLEAAPASRASGHPEWEQHARERAAALEPTLSRLTIVVPPDADVEGLDIERDGKKVLRAEWGAAIPVDPGAHPVVATAPAKQQWSTTVAVGPSGAQASVTIPRLSVEQHAGDATAPSTGATGMAPPSRESIPVVDGSTQRTVGLVVGAAGIVALGVGGAFGIVAKSTYDSAIAKCTPQNTCPASGVSGVSDARGQATLATVMMALGAGALVGGGITYFTAPRSPSRSVALRAVAAPGGGAVMLGGSW